MQVETLTQLPHYFLWRSAISKIFSLRNGKCLALQNLIGAKDFNKKLSKMRILFTFIQIP